MSSGEHLLLRHSLDELPRLQRTGSLPLVQMLPPTLLTAILEMPALPHQGRTRPLLVVMMIPLELLTVFLKLPVLPRRERTWPLPVAMRLPLELLTVLRELPVLTRRERTWLVPDSTSWGQRGLQITGWNSSSEPQPALKGPPRVGGHDW